MKPKQRKDVKTELLRTGMGCFAFAAAVSAFNVLILPYARAWYPYKMLPVLLVCALTVCGFLLLGRKLRSTGLEQLEHVRRVSTPALIIMLFVFQLILGYLLEYTPAGDNFMLIRGSQTLARDGNFDAYPDFYLYFSRFSNQWGFLLMLTGVFKLLALFGLQDCLFALVFLQALLYVAAMKTLLSLARRLSGARGEIMLTAMLALCLPLYLAAAVLYTDTFSMAFVIFTLYFAFKTRDAQTAKGQLLCALCCGLSAFIGGQIKMTVAIALIAAIIWWALTLRPVRTALCAGICALMMIAGGACVERAMLSFVLDPAMVAQHNTPTLHWIMMSIPTGDNPYGGATGDYGITWGMQEEGTAREEVMDSIYTRIKDRIYTLRYPNRLLQAALRKNSATMGDGTYGMTEMLDDGPVRENIVSQFVLSDRPYYGLYSTVCVGISIAHLLLALAGCVKDIKKRDVKLSMLHIAMFGIMLFLMIWEARGRYVFGFMPVLYLLSSARAAKGVRQA